jgi:diguanylate cyclase (GGDEF)-like protein/PAS domain S-box-containing protein
MKIRQQEADMQSIWQPLLANLAVIAIAISLWTSLYDWVRDIARGRMSIAFGLMSGVVSIAVMANPFEIAPGIFFDLRVVPVALAGFFSGLTGGLIAALMAILFRIWMGGVGVELGIFGILIALVMSVYLKRRQGTAPPVYQDIFNLGLANAGGSIVALAAMPAEHFTQLFERGALPGVTLVVVAIFLSGTSLVLKGRQRAMARANEVYSAIVDALPDCLNAKDAEGRFLIANPATARLMGAASKFDLIGKTDADFLTSETAAEFLSHERAVIQLGRAQTLEQKFQQTDGSIAWLSTLKVPFPNADGREIGLISHNRDITPHKQLELSLREAQSRLSDALTHMADGLLMFDGEGRLVLCSERFRMMFNAPSEYFLVGTPFRAVLKEAGRCFGIQIPQDIAEAEWYSQEEARVAKLEMSEFKVASGRWYLTRHARVDSGGWLTLFSDITEVKRQKQELLDLNAKLEVLARIDGLTSLTNRKTFDEKLYVEFARSQRHGNALGLLIADVDRFKAYNDTYGHPEGDLCLQAVAECLQRVGRRPTDVVARYGGEEFVAIFPEVGEQGMQLLAEQFRQAVQDMQRVHTGSEKRVVTVSVGVAVMSKDTELRGPGDLVRAADEALYRAKAAGRNCVRTASLPSANTLQEQKAS